MLSWILLAAAPALAPQVPAPVPYRLDGLVNGDFEHLLATGEMDNAVTPGDPVDGAFWVGAEAKTIDVGGNRVLSLPRTERVYQRVGCPPSATSTAKLTAQVTYKNGNDEARISFTEGGGDVLSWRWVFRNHGEYGGIFEYFFEDSNTTLKQLSYDPMSREYGDGQTSAIVRYAKTVVPPDTKVFGQVQATETGAVRVVYRPRRRGPSSGLLPMTILRDPDGLAGGQAGTPVAFQLLDPSHADGVVYVHRFEVAAGDYIVFELDNSAGTGDTNIYFEPWVINEGRRLTYRVGRKVNINPPDPAAIGGEQFINVQQQPASATQVLDVGADWASVFGTGLDAAPPLDVELSAGSSNNQPVEFDNVECSIEFQSYASEADFRLAIGDELAWSRDMNRFRADRQEQTFNGQLGPLPSPYNAHKVFAYLGPDHVPNVSGSGATPVSPYITDAHDTLEEMFDAGDHADFNWVRQQELHTLTDPSGLMRTKYNVESDIRFLSGYSVSPKRQIEDASHYYALTGDVEALDAIARAANAAVAFAILEPNKNQHPLLFTGDIHDVSTGATTSALPLHLGMLTQNGGIPMLARAFDLCMQFNADHPHISPPRFSTADLQSWLNAIEAAADKHRSITYYVVDPQGGVTMGPGWNANQNYHWAATEGMINDRFGYQAGGSARAARYLEPWTGDPTFGPQVQSSVDFLWDVWGAGTEALFDVYEQATGRGAYVPSDETRSTPVLVAYVNDTTQSDPQTREDLRKAMILRSFFTIKHMNPLGVWTNASHEWFQLADRSLSNSGSVKFFAIGEHLQIASAILGDEFAQDLTDLGYTREDVIALLSTVYLDCKDHFRTQAGLTNGYGYSGDATLPTPRPTPVFPPPPFPYIPPFAWTPVNTGFERRLLGNLELSFEHLQGVEEAPVVTCSLPNYSAAPAAGQTSPAVAFTIAMAAPATNQELQDQLDQRTELELWKEDASGVWAPANLWPSRPNLFAAPSFGADQVTLNLNPGIVPATGEFKLLLRTHNEAGRLGGTATRQLW